MFTCAYLQNSGIQQRLLLITNRKQHVAFRFFSKSITFYDPEPPLRTFCLNLVFFWAKCAELTAARPILSATNMYSWESAFWQYAVYEEYSWEFPRQRVLSDCGVSRNGDALCSGASFYTYVINNCRKLSRSSDAWNQTDLNTCTVSDIPKFKIHSIAFNSI